MRELQGERTAEEISGEISMKTPRKISEETPRRIREESGSEIIEGIPGYFLEEFRRISQGKFLDEFPRKLRVALPEELLQKFSLLVELPGNSSSVSRRNSQRKSRGKS